MFLRSRGGTDPVTCLWTLDLATGDERLVADPAALEQPGDGGPARPRRGPAGSAAGSRPAAWSATPPTGRSRWPRSPLVRAALRRRAHRRASPRALVDTPGRGDRPAARPDGQPRRLRQRRRAARARSRPPAPTTVLAEPDGPGVSYGLADFVAAEEMGRMRGYWWAPDGDALVVARVDESPVQRWHIADPANPDRTPTVVAYPAAGTPNARVTAEIITLDGTRTPVRWDTERDEYLVDVALGRARAADRRAAAGPDARCARWRSTPRPARRRAVSERTDPAWVDIVPGVPATTAAGALVDGRPTPTAPAGSSSTASRSPRRRLQVRGVLGRRRRHRAAPRRAPTRRRSACGRGARTGSRSRPPARACTPARLRRRHARGRPRRTSTSTARPRTVHRSTRRRRRVVTVASLRRAARASMPRVTLRRPGDRAGTAAPRCCCRPGTSRAPGCRCSWTPTAARTRSACSPPGTRT